MTPADRAILEFEDQHPRHTGTKQETIRTELGLTYPRYLQRLNYLVETPAAVAAYPQVCARVQRLNEARGLARAQRRIAA